MGVFLLKTFSIAFELNDIGVRPVEYFINLLIHSFTLLIGYPVVHIVFSVIPYRLRQPTIYQHRMVSLQETLLCQQPIDNYIYDKITFFHTDKVLFEWLILSTQFAHTF